MQYKIQPNYEDINVTCSCGNNFNTKSTICKKNISIEVCSMCHPFYTGKQRFIDISGRIDYFEKRFGKIENNKT